MSKFGAFVRRRSRSSIRKRKRVSAPGHPPSSHEGTLRRFIYFVYDRVFHSVIIGPERTNQIFFDRNRRPVKGTVPQILEEGGDITVFEVRRHGRWQRADLRSRRRIAGLEQRYRTAHIRPRPYMLPAYEAELKNLPALMADSVHA